MPNFDRFCPKCLDDAVCAWQEGEDEAWVMQCEKCGFSDELLFFLTEDEWGTRFTSFGDFHVAFLE